MMMQSVHLCARSTSQVFVFMTVDLLRLMTVPFLPYLAVTFLKAEEKKNEYVWSLTTHVRYMLIKEHPFCMATFSSTLVNSLAISKGKS